MPGGNKRINIFLLLLTVLLCFGCGYLFRQTTAVPSKLEDETIELFTADDTGELLSHKNEVPEEEKSSVQVSPSPSAEPTATPALIKVSPEASSGVWTSSGSSWMFMVNGAPYTGWLTDTDGKRYFFDSNGIMQTGWVEDNGKRYFMDLDGIMQTGFVTTGGKSYELLADGSLKDYQPEKEQKKEVQKDTKASKQTKTSKEKPAKKEKKYVALTFDDGPSSFTNRLLDCLEKNKAKATFFMVGKEIEYFSDEVKRMKNLGCELGNHTYSHADLTGLSPEDISSEIGAVDNLLMELTGQGASVVRPPYGSVNSTVKSVVGTPMILWSIDTLDWESQDPQKIAEIVRSQAEDGSIILLHDIFSTSVDAAEIFIPEMIKEGYQFVTVHELAEKNGIKLQTGTTYSDLKKQS
ncbi:hypothetical protein JCM17039_27050 [Blautia glucerasea]